MTLKLSKVRGVADAYTFEYDDGNKKTVWHVDGSDVDRQTILDVYNSTHPYKVPLDHTYEASVKDAPYFQPPLFSTEDLIKQTNKGLAMAEQAAHDEETRLKNMGAALRTEVGMPANAIPVFEEGMPPVNWNA